MMSERAKQKWSKYIEFFEGFNERSIPNILKDVSKILKTDISESTSKFDKKYNIDAFDFRVRLNFNKTEYYSNINLLKIITDPSKNVYIEVNIPTIYDVDYVVAIIIHEIRHIYDIYTINSENEMQSFVDDFHMRKLKIGNYTNFINLVYLSLEHELIARNNMIYPYVGLKNITKEESTKIIKESFIYDSLIKLGNFDHKSFINSMDSKELIELTNLFIKDVAKKDNLCVNISDVIIFYKKWEEYFKNIKIEWEIELNKEISKIYEYVRPSYNEGIIGGTHRLFKIIYNDIFY